MPLIEERIGVNGEIVTYDKVAIAIENLRTYEQIALQKTGDDGNNGFYVCVSGGKDSSVIQELCLMAGVKCQFYHNHTGLDHPKTVYFVRSEKKRIEALGYNFYITPPKKYIQALARKRYASDSVGAVLLCRAEGERRRESLYRHRSKAS